MADLASTFSVPLFGVTGYATTDPVNVDAIHRTEFQSWGMGSRRTALLPFLGEGIFTQDNAPWRHSRELIRRQFKHLHINNRFTSLHEDVERFVSYYTDAQGEVDLQPHLHRFTLSTTTKLLFGEPVEKLGEEATTEFSESFDYASKASSLRIRLADVCWLYAPSKYKRACSIVKSYAGIFVQRALKAQSDLGPEEAQKLYPFILDLYSQMQDRTVVRDQLVNVLIAGRDSTADTMGWTFFQLLRHPSVLRNLRQEIARTVGDDPDFKSHTVRRMPYSQAVLSEILRLYPQVPVNLRFATDTTVLPRGGGKDGKAPVLIPKGTGVAISVYHMHRRPDLFGSDAASFRPERWQTGELDNIGCAYMPFHSGPRTYLEQDFALDQMSYLITRMIQTYPRMRLPENIKIDPVGAERQTWSLLVSSADGCKVILN